MAVIIRIESLDDEPELHSFASIDDAAAFAKEWFLSGYEGLDAIEYAREHAEQIASDLINNGQFICNLFYERISVIEPPRALAVPVSESTWPEEPRQVHEHH